MYWIELGLLGKGDERSHSVSTAEVYNLWILTSNSHIRLDGVVLKVQEQPLPHHSPSRKPNF